MAGDWIKMRGNLWDDPRISGLVEATGTSEAAVIGGLYWLWATADQHTEDGCMPRLTLRQIDRKTGITGFAAALVDIGWLAEQERGVTLLNFSDHNGASAKKRAVTAKRVAGHRSGNADVTLPALPNEPEHGTGALAREREEVEKEKSRNTNSVPYGTGAGAPSGVRQGVSAQDQVFAIGVTLLTAASVSDKHARSFLAAQCKAHGPVLVLDALQTCASERAIEPVPRIVEILARPGKATRLNPQEALEASNREVARKWAEGSTNAAA